MSNLHKFFSFDFRGINRIFSIARISVTHILPDFVNTLYGGVLSSFWNFLKILKQRNFSKLNFYFGIVRESGSDLLSTNLRFFFFNKIWKCLENNSTFCHLGKYLLMTQRFVFPRHLIRDWTDCFRSVTIFFFPLITFIVVGELCWQHSIFPIPYYCFQKFKWVLGIYFW